MDRRSKFVSVVAGMFIAISNPAQAEALFSPTDCEFSVMFPGTYEQRQLFDSAGQSVVMAKTRNGEALKLSAECWPRHDIEPDEYAKRIAPKMADRGIRVHSVNVQQTDYGKVVTLAGAAGEGREKYFVRFVSHFGSKTRLDLLIIEKSAIASDGHLAFRNSVRTK